MLTEHDLDTARVELKKTRQSPKITLKNPIQVVEFAKSMENFDREWLRVVSLDSKRRVLGVETASIGVLDSAVVHPREILKGVLLYNSSGAIIIHNHPSGVSTPSMEDKAVVAKLFNAFSTMGVALLDSVIIGRGEYFSFHEAGQLPKAPLIDIIHEGGFMEVKESAESEECEVALRVAREILDEKCGVERGKEIEVEGVRLRVPSEVLSVREAPDLTYEQRVSAIQQSRWAQREAEGLCGKLFGTVAGTEDHLKCVDRVSKKLAEGMVRG